MHTTFVRTVFVEILVGEALARRGRRPWSSWRSKQWGRFITAKGIGLPSRGWVAVAAVPYREQLVAVAGRAHVIDRRRLGRAHRTQLTSAAEIGPRLHENFEMIGLRCV